MELNDSALVAPFVGERYGNGVRLSDVVAPPYDVIGEAERAALAERHACNVVHVILPQGDGDRYGRAAKHLAQWRNTGQLVADPGPGLYVVSQRFVPPGGTTRARTGVIAAVVAEPFAKGRVKPHEKTHAGPKQDRLDLFRATGTMCEALLMMSRDSTGALRRMLGEVTAAHPFAQAELEGVEISLWRVDQPRAAPLAAVAGHEPLYVADGHHRYETTVAYRAENAAATRTLALIVPLGDPGLVVLPTHRLVPGERVPDEVLARMTDHFVVEALPSVGDARGALTALGRGPGGCVVVLERKAFRLSRREGTVPAALSGWGPVVGSLDVAWADTLVVPWLKQAAGEKTLRYTPDLEIALRVVRDGEAGAAVLLNPPGVEDVLAVADAAEFMPPKATFFTPKVPSGLVFLNYGRPTS
ncbi:MAG: DUF1015 domain-containing protein [Gemmatimonadetes bacterium]|nr:DUF1015 domain-containing protein [Gemmatimonadota bacterium]